jgi:hypothetical protein
LILEHQVKFPETLPSILGIEFPQNMDEETFGLLHVRIHSFLSQAHLVQDRVGQSR